MQTINNQTLKKELAASRQKYGELLQVHDKIFEHNEQLLVRNRELEQVIQKMDAEKSAFVENMAILVQKNEQLEEEIKIMAKALEMKDADESVVQNLTAELQSQRQKYEELEFQCQEGNVTIQNLEEQILQIESKKQRRAQKGIQADILSMADLEQRDRQILSLKMIIKEYEHEMKDLTNSLEQKQAIIVKYALYVEQQLQNIDQAQSERRQGFATQKDESPPKQKLLKPQNLKLITEIREEKNRNLLLLQEIQKFRPSASKDSQIN